MSYKYTPEELIEKVDYEGGLFDAFFGYGIEVSEVPDERLQEALRAAAPVIAFLEDAWNDFIEKHYQKKSEVDREVTPID